MVSLSCALYLLKSPTYAMDLIPPLQRYIHSPINLGLFIPFESIRLPLIKFLQHPAGMGIGIITVFGDLFQLTLKSL